jgi:SAM-dependent methyltransferase
MLTDDKKITTADYWSKVYNGDSHGKVDNSRTKRPPNPFDRFTWLADVVEGPTVLDIASGHAHTCKIIKRRHPDWQVIASDQTRAAMKAANYQPYLIMDAYEIPYEDKSVTTITISQALEYLEFPNRFMREARRVAAYFVCTVPVGIMSKWSQLREYQPEPFKRWLTDYGIIEHFDAKADIMLAKVKF